MTNDEIDSVDQERIFKLAQSRANRGENCKCGHPIKVIERFLSKVSKVSNNNDCWIWMGSKVPNGYGHLRVNKQYKLAHRFCWELIYGSIPKNLWVLHHCDNPPCVNPNHLFLGTRSDNMKDAVNKGRKIWPPSQFGENNPMHKLTLNQVHIIKKLKGSHTARELAKQFKVAKSTITMIWSNQNWKNQ